MAQLIGLLLLVPTTVGAQPSDTGDGSRRANVRSAVDTTCALSVVAPLTGVDVNAKIVVGVADACRSVPAADRRCKVINSVDDDVCMQTLDGLAPAASCRVSTLSCELAGSTQHSEVDLACLSAKANYAHHPGAYVVRAVHDCVKHSTGSCVATAGSFDPECFLAAMTLIGATPTVADDLEIARTCHRYTLSCAP